MHRVSFKRLPPRSTGVCFRPRFPVKTTLALRLGFFMVALLLVCYLQRHVNFTRLPPRLSGVCFRPRSPVRHKFVPEDMRDIQYLSAKDGLPKYPELSALPVFLFGSNGHASTEARSDGADMRFIVGRDNEEHEMVSICPDLCPEARTSFSGDPRKLAPLLLLSGLHPHPGPASRDAFLQQIQDDIQYRAAKIQLDEEGPEYHPPNQLDDGFYVRRPIATEARVIRKLNLDELIPEGSRTDDTALAPKNR